MIGGWQLEFEKRLADQKIDRVYGFCLKIYRKRSIFDYTSHLRPNIEGARRISETKWQLNLSATTG